MNIAANHSFVLAEAFVKKYGFWLINQPSSTWSTCDIGGTGVSEDVIETKVSTRPLKSEAKAEAEDGCYDEAKRKLWGHNVETRDVTIYKKHRIWINVNDVISMTDNEATDKAECYEAEAENFGLEVTLASRTSHPWHRQLEHTDT